MLHLVLYLEMKKKKSPTRPCAREARYTLFCNFNFTPAKFGLLDVLHAEVTAAVGVDLGFVPGGGLIIGAVGVGRSWETENTKGHY